MPPQPSHAGDTQNKRPPLPRSVEWHGYEYEHRVRSTDWFWGVGFFALSSAIAAFILGNVLFGLLVIMAAFVLALLASRGPEISRFVLSERGLTINRQLFPYQTFNSFWITHEDENAVIPYTTPKLLIRSKKALIPIIVIPLVGVDPELVRRFLLRVLEEEHLQEPLAHHILDQLGF